MYDDTELIVRFALQYYNTVGKWEQMPNGNYGLHYEGKIMVEHDPHTHMWRMIESDKQPLHEKDLTPEGKTVVYTFLRAYCGG